MMLFKLSYDTYQDITALEELKFLINKNFFFGAQNKHPYNPNSFEINLWSWLPKYKDFIKSYATKP